MLASSARFIKRRKDWFYSSLREVARYCVLRDNTPSTHTLRCKRHRALMAKWLSTWIQLHQASGTQPSAFSARTDTPTRSFRNAERQYRLARYVHSRRRRRWILRQTRWFHYQTVNARLVVVKRGPREFHHTNPSSIRRSLIRTSCNVDVYTCTPNR